MATFVLVHGAWHGGWCWTKVVSLLEAAGHTALAPDLPGHGADRPPPRAVTAQLYADRVCSVVGGQPEPVVLVGHSMGGGVIAAAGEQCPDNIARLVFLAAFASAPGIAPVGHPSDLLLNAIVRDEAEGSMTVRDDAVVPAFYHDCSAEDIALARAHLVPEPLAAAGPQPQQRLTEARFGRIPRAYIVCLQDRALPPAQQQAMATAAACTPVLTLETSHSPFFSAPSALVQQLISLA